MSKSTQPNSTKNSLLKRLPHLQDLRTDSIANHMIAKKKLDIFKKTNNPAVTKVGSPKTDSSDIKPMDIEPSQEIGEGSAGIYQGLSDNFANMSINKAETTSAQSHGAPQTATSSSSSYPAKPSDPYKTIGN